jgi:hypothetical protein
VVVAFETSARDGNDAASVAGGHVGAAWFMATTSIQSTMGRICCKLVAAVVACRSRTDWS